MENVEELGLEKLQEAFNLEVLKWNKEFMWFDKKQIIIKICEKYSNEYELILNIEIGKYNTTYIKINIDITDNSCEWKILDISFKSNRVNNLLDDVIHYVVFNVI